jgi:hypothetical protein
LTIAPTASGRGLARSLGELRKRRQFALSVANGPPLSVVSGSLSVVSGKVEARQEPNAPNEPTDGGENVTNEPTDAGENVTNEPTDAGENVTNEPTDRRIKATTELELASDCEDAESIEAGAGTEDEDNDDLESPPTYEEELGAQMRQVLRNRKSMRMHEMVELVEERRKVVEQIMADRRAQRLQERIQNGKRESRPEGQGACTGQGNRRENPARQKTELDEPLKTVSAVYDEVKRAPG